MASDKYRFVASSDGVARVLRVRGGAVEKMMHPVLVFNRATEADDVDGHTLA